MDMILSPNLSYSNRRTDLANRWIDTHDWSATVPVAGWECASLNSRPALAQPGYIPAPFLDRHTHNGNFDTRRGISSRISVAAYLKSSGLYLKLVTTFCAKNQLRVNEELQPFKRIITTYRQYC